MENLIRKEIDQILTKMPDVQLKSVLAYLKAMEKLNQENNKSSELVEKILLEDANLLKRLAQ